MKIKRSAFAGVIALSTVFSSSVYATNGIFLIGVGAKSRSMGGVGIGYAQDGLANQLNPAGISDIGVKTMRVDADMLILSPHRSATIPDPRVPPNAGNPITYRSGANLYAIPALAAVYKFNRKLNIGFSFAGVGGGGTRYTRLSPLGYNFFNPVGRTGISDTLGVNFAVAEMAITGAYKINKQNTVAVSPVFGVSTFRAFGLGVFQPFSSDPENMTGRGNDYAYGAGVRLGWQGKVGKWLTLGAAYTSRIYFTKFDKYRGLFAEQGSMDMPENVGLGLAIKPVKNLTLAFDWQRVFYSDVNSIGNPIENLASTDGFLGEDGGAGFGWEDQDVYKFGIKYRVTPAWDVQVGYNYAEAPMPNDQLLFSAIAPAVTEKHLTLGVSYRPSKGSEWTLAYVHAFDNTEKGLANSGGQFDQFFPNEDLSGPGNVELQMVQDSVELTFAYKL